MENKPQGTCAFGHEKSRVFTVPYFSIRPSRSKKEPAPLSPVPLYFSSLSLLRTALHYLNAWNRLPTPAPSVHLKIKLAAINGETRGISTISRKNRGLWTVYKKRNFGSFWNRIPPSPILRSLYQWRVFKKTKSGRIRGRNKVTRKFIVELLDDIRKTDWTRIENPGLRFLRTAATLACEQQTLFFSDDRKCLGCSQVTATLVSCCKKMQR